jgi:Mce-associated membrane protein
VPPSRRRPPPSAGATPPVRRPRVAGLRNRNPHDEDTHESISGTLDDTQDDTPDAHDEPEARAEEEDSWAEPVPGIDLGTDEPEATEDTETTEAEPAARPKPAGRRPAGKRRTSGVTRPSDLSAAEAEAATPTPAADRPRRATNPMQVAIVLAVMAVLLAGLAFWFRGEADALDSADRNTALTDSATTSEVTGQLTSAIEDTFSYNYSDLASTEKAVDATLTGTARCEYDKLFTQVKELAPKQKIIIGTSVRDIALVRLDGDRAEALIFIDQNSTRVDNNKSQPVAALFGVQAHREGDKWKITDFNMFDQTLVNGQQAPQC